MFSKRMRQKLMEAKNQQQSQVEQQKQIEQAQQQAQQQGAKKKWVLPVVIVGSLAVVGTIVFFIVKKRNQ
jgi:folylpolyglutamate synthase/dihydropteroate synthase